MRLSRNDIEQIGNRVNRAYKRLPSLRGQLIQRIEPERLAKEVCGLNLGYFHLSKDESILGLTSFSKTEVEVADEERGAFFYELDGKTILIESNLANSENQQGRLHFTIMHEVAHQVLKMLYPDEKRGTYCRVHYCLACRHQRSGGDWDEWQADNLASVLLLPADLVINTACDFGLGGGIKVLNRVFYQREYELFSAMAEQLGTSKQALAIRLKGLGLLEREYLKDPYALVDIVKEADEE